jgi:branched-chain amino acid transport system permease protein
MRASRRTATSKIAPAAILRDGRASKSAVADFDTLRLPKSGKPDFGARPPYTKVKNKILPMSRIGEQTFVRSGRPRRWATQDEVRGYDFDRAKHFNIRNRMMIGWIDSVIQGVLLGGLYALFAAGLSLIFGIMRLVNLAHGDLIVLAAFVILAAAHALGLGAFTATAVALPVMFAAGYALQFLVLNRTLGPDILPPLLVTFGLSIIVQNSLLEMFSADSQRLSAGAIETASIPLGSGLAVGLMPLVTFVSAVAVILLLNVLFYSTALGRAFRATSDDADIAQLMGIETRRVFAMAMAVAMVVVTIAALYLGMRATFDPTSGPARLLYAFEAVIIGGLGSLWGTLAGGVIIGVAQTVGANINPEWQILAGHLAFLAVLMLRPRGLFPRTAD